MFKQYENIIMLSVFFSHSLTKGVRGKRKWNKKMEKGG